MDRERDDVAVKDILSQLSRDETVLEEVRKIALRGLSGDLRTTPPATSQDRERTNPTAASDRPSGSTTDSGGKERRETGLRQAAPGGKEEELAFTVSKDSDTYRSVFSTVQWYRDSFLIGSAFADQRSAERNASSGQHSQVESGGDRKFIPNQQNAPTNGVPKSDPATAMAHPLLLSSAESYLRSVAAVDLLRPYAMWIASKDGPMFSTATQSLAQTIPLGQSSCDWAMRENLLWVLQDEEWKEFAKSITTKYVDRSYRDG